MGNVVTDRKKSRLCQSKKKNQQTTKLQTTKKEKRTPDLYTTKIFLFFFFEKISKKLEVAQTALVMSPKTAFIHMEKTTNEISLEEVTTTYPARSDELLFEYDHKCFPPL